MPTTAAPTRHRLISRQAWRLTAAVLMVGAAIGAGVVLRSPAAGATTDTVTNCNDSGPGSLRDAVNNAAANDVINFSANLSPCTAGTITLTSGPIDIEVPLTITGPGPGVLAVSGGGTSRVFEVDATTLISGLTIEDGDAGDGTTSSGLGDGGDGGAGGGISATAELTLSVCVVTANRAGNGGGSFLDNGGNGGDGGGIEQTDGLTLDASTVSDNSAGAGGGTTDGTGGAGGDGGGVAGPGPLVITDSTISQNTAGSGGQSTFATGGDGGDGGGVSSGSSITLTGSSITGNGAGAGGSSSDGGAGGAGGAGGGLNAGTNPGTISDSVISDNTSGDGGGAFGSVGAGNGGGGGGIATADNLSLTGSTVAGNRTGAGGANFVSAGGNGGDGGGLSNTGILDVTDSTVSGNTAAGGGSGASGGDGGSGGGIGNDQGLFVTTSTVADNDAGPGGEGVNGGNGGSGGGIDSDFGLTITSSTVALNAAGGPGLTQFGGTNGSGGSGGGIAIEGQWSPESTIVADNPVGGDCDVTAIVIDRGYNLDDDGSCPLVGTGDVTDAAGLDPSGLQGNGGPTKTIALVPGSAAIAGDADASACQVPDQRGVARPQPCAIGAYEPVITLSPSGLPSATAETFYDEFLMAAGGTGGPYTFSAPPGTLPAGLSLAGDGELSGIPTVVGSSFTFEVTASDGAISGIRIYTLSIATPTITVAPVPLPTITAETPVVIDLSGGGGVTPYTFAVTGGAPPTGLKLETGGELHGTTATPGPYSFTVTATDDNGFTGTETYSGSVAAPTIVVAPPTVGSPTWGTFYTVTFSATGGASPYDFSESGTLPTGLTLDPTTGKLTGTPTDKTQIGHLFTFSVTATDAGQFAGTEGYSFTLGSPCLPGLTPYLLSATARTGNFTGTFCVNGAGSGTYTQGSVHGTGTVTSSFGVTRVTAFGTDLSLIGQKTTTTSTFTETAPAPAKAGTFTLM